MSAMDPGADGVHTGMKKTIGQTAYEAYIAEAPLNDCRRYPSWETLGKSRAGCESQRRWEASAAAVRRVVVGQDTEGP